MTGRWFKTVGVHLLVGSIATGLAWSVVVGLIVLLSSDAQEGAPEAAAFGSFLLMPANLVAGLIMASIGLRIQTNRRWTVLSTWTHAIAEGAAIAVVLVINARLYAYDVATSGAGPWIGVGIGTVVSALFGALGGVVAGLASREVRPNPGTKAIVDAFS